MQWNTFGYLPVFKPIEEKEKRNERTQKELTTVFETFLPFRF